MYRNAFDVKIKEQSCVSNILNKEEVSSCQSSQSHQLETPKAAKKNVSINFYTKSGSLVSKILNTSFGTRSFDESKSEHNESRKGKTTSSFSQPISYSKKEIKGSPSPITRELWREVISAEANASSNVNEPSSGVQSGETPNKLSEELVRCMAAIYCNLVDPPISHLAENTSPYTSMVAVHWICADNYRLQYAEKMLQNFRSLVQELERLNPGKLKHEEKLAFWLNIYNALMMHAYLAYGIPRSQIKRVSLLQKASYKIGAHSINAHTIEHTILGCKSHRPSQA